MTPQQVREAVDALPYTQREIAEKIGVSHQHLRNILNGQAELSEVGCLHCGKSTADLLRMLVDQ